MQLSSKSLHFARVGSSPAVVVFEIYFKESLTLLGVSLAEFLPNLKFERKFQIPKFEVSSKFHLEESF